MQGGCRSGAKYDALSFADLAGGGGPSVQGSFQALPSEGWTPLSSPQLPVNSAAL